MIKRLRLGLHKADELLVRIGAAWSTFLAPPADPGRAAVAAVEARIASMLRENRVLRGAVSAILARRAGTESTETTIAQEALEQAAIERAERGEREGDA